MKTHTRRGKIQGTLCWECANAVPDRGGHGCPWSEQGARVPGWTADRSDLPKVKGRSYFVHECPLFEAEPERKVVVY